MLKIKLVISCMLVSLIFQSSFFDSNHFSGSTPRRADPVEKNFLSTHSSIAIWLKLDRRPLPDRAPVLIRKNGQHRKCC